MLTLLWFSLLGSRDLIEPDEGRYAEIPREIVASGDWITPRLDGFKYFQKPPLQYWLTAAGYQVLGIGNGSARLWPALLGFAGAVVAGLLGARLYGRDAGLATFLVLASSFLFFVMGHTLTLDMTVSVFLFLGIACLVLAQLGRGWPAGAHWMWLGWAALAGATLSKGLIGLVLPGAAVLLYSLWQRDWALWRHLELGIRAEPQRWFGSFGQFAQHWTAERQAFAVMGKPYYQQYLASGLPMRLVYTGPRLVVVSRE